MIESVKEAKRLIKLAGLFCFCDKLKSGEYSLKLRYSDYEPVCDLDVDELLMGQLCMLSSASSKVPFTERNQYGLDRSRRPVEGKWTSRFRFKPEDSERKMRVARAMWLEVKS
jgi:hypothetical protein